MIMEGFRIRDGIDLRVGGASQGLTVWNAHRGTPVGIGAIVGGSANKRPMVPPKVDLEQCQPPPVVVATPPTPIVEVAPSIEGMGWLDRGIDYAFFLCCFFALQLGAWGGAGFPLPLSPGEGPMCGECAPMWQHVLVPVLSFYVGWRHGGDSYWLQGCGLACSLGLSAFLASSGEYVASKVYLFVSLVSASIYASGKLWVNRGKSYSIVPMGGMLIMLALLAVAIQDPSVVLSVWGLLALCTVWL